MRTTFFLLAAALIASPVLGQTTFTNVVEAANATSSLSTLVAAVQSAGLAGTLSDPTLVATVFAPSDQAFTNYLAANNLTATQLLAAPTLGSVLKYHVVPGVAARAANLTDGQVVPTLLGPNLTVRLSNGTVTVVGAANNATVSTADVTAGQAVVHIIDAVLIAPPVAPAPAPSPYYRG